MTITKKQQEEFRALVSPLMKWLSGFHPHVHVTVNSTEAELVEGVAAFQTTEYLKD